MHEDCSESKALPRLLDLGSFFLPRRQTFGQLIMEVPSNDVANALLRVTQAGMILVALNVEAIIKGNFLIGSNIPKCLQANPFTILNGLAVRITRVIDQAGRIPAAAPVFSCLSN